MHTECLQNLPSVKPLSCKKYSILLVRPEKSIQINIFNNLSYQAFKISTNLACAHEQFCVTSEVFNKGKATYLQIQYDAF